MIIGPAERLRDIAPWLGLRFVAVLSHWRDRAKALDCEARDLRPVIWDKFSTLNEHEVGAGLSRVTRDCRGDAPVMALLTVGTILHAGRAASKGSGRYDLEVAGE